MGRWDEGREALGGRMCATKAPGVSLQIELFIKKPIRQTALQISTGPEQAGRGVKTPKSEELPNSSILSLNRRRSLVFLFLSEIDNSTISTTRLAKRSIRRRDFFCIVFMAMYIRVKRSKTTYFLQCDPTETILDIKQKLHTLTDQPINDQRLILVGTGEILDDSRTLADQKVENDAVVALTLRKDDNEFEDVNILRPNDDFYQARDPDGSW